MFTNYLNNSNVIENIRLLLSKSHENPFILSGINSEVIEELETEFIKKFEVNYAISTCNATNAVLLCLYGLNIKPGDEIIVSEYCWEGIIIPILMLNAIPVIAKSLNKSFSIDPNSLIELISPKTKAVFITHYLGFPADIESILSISRKYQLKVVFDCSQALGALFDNKQLSNYGDINIFSFGYNKNLYIGEGGMISFKYKKDYDKVLSISQHPIKLNYVLCSTKRKKISTYIFNSRMSPLTAILGIQCLKSIQFQAYLVKKINTFKRSFQSLSDSDLESYLINFPALATPISSSIPVFVPMNEKKIINYCQSKQFQLFKIQSVCKTLKYVTLNYRTSKKTNKNRLQSDQIFLINL